MIKFYKEAATDNWVCGVKRKIAAGTCTMEANADNSYIEIKENGIDKTIAEGNPTSFVNEAGVAYADFAALEAATSDFFVKAGSEPATPKLDFLLIDQWLHYQDWDNPLSENLILLVYNNRDDIKSVTEIGRAISIDGDLQWAFDTNIPQTTIFVHPTTFQRYLFNGTEMVEYDDVDGIVPKWLKYEALLTQSGTYIDNTDPENPAEKPNPPTARVLNADERDYLGDIDFSSWSTNTGFYWSNRYLFNPSLTMVSIPNSKATSMGLLVNSMVDNSGNLLIATTVFTGTAIDSCDGILENTPISIKQRVRGNPPKLVSAETNTTGDKVILTFDKELDNTNDGNGFNLSLSTTGGDYTEYFFNHNLVSINKNVVTLNTSPNNWTNSVGIVHGDTVNMNVPPVGSSSLTETIDFGILQGGDFTATNNVPAPPQLLDAYTNEDGSIVTLVFDKNISEVHNAIYYPNLFDVYGGESGGIDPLSVNFNMDKITITNNVNCIPGEVLSLSYNSSVNLKSEDGGILQSFLEYPITNNVI